MKNWRSYLEAVKTDCRFYRGDRPCKFHKESGIHCQECPHYSPVNFRILIIKLGAGGDILRTTVILPALKEKYPQCYIVWVTKSEYFSLFINNNFVDEVLDFYSPEMFARVGIEEYDLVINLDNTKESGILAELAKGKRKFGFGYHNGHIYAFDEASKEWLTMAMFDDLKKQNTKSYQDIILDICHLKPKKWELILNLTEDELSFADEFAKKHNLNLNKLIIGLNTGAGKRWPQKIWSAENYIRLIKLLKSKYPTSWILLYGGPEEIEKNKYILKSSNTDIIDTGCTNTRREFSSLLNLSQIFVTGDTFALHIAVALKKKVIALFGPTSHAEIELYDRGKKVFADLDCLCCYRESCNEKPSCMDLITPEKVLRAIEESR